MGEVMDDKYIRRRVNELGPWYHSIRLTDKITTPGREYDKIWNSIRSVMNHVEYNGKDVLDIASWDGMWAFDAEARGAKSVVATDVRTQGAANLLFCKEVLGSKVFPLFNAQVQDLPERLKVVGLQQKFDIVQHLGLFYHLRDPVLSLTQARAVLKEGGLLILETAAILGDDRPIMFFNGSEEHYYWGGPSDTWAPTSSCLELLLKRSSFQPVMTNIWQETGAKSHIEDRTFSVGRLCIVAQAVSADGLHRVDREKVSGNQ